MPGTWPRMGCKGWGGAGAWQGTRSWGRTTTAPTRRPWGGVTEGCLANCRRRASTRRSPGCTATNLTSASAELPAPLLRPPNPGKMNLAEKIPVSERRQERHRARLRGRYDHLPAVAVGREYRQAAV